MLKKTPGKCSIIRLVSIFCFVCDKEDLAFVIRGTVILSIVTLPPHPIPPQLRLPDTLYKQARIICHEKHEQWRKLRKALALSLMLVFIRSQKLLILACVHAFLYLIICLLILTLICTTSCLTERGRLLSEMTLVPVSVRRSFSSSLNLTVTMLDALSSGLINTSAKLN